MEHRSYMIKQGGSHKSVSFLFFILVFSSFSSFVSSDNSSLNDYYEVEILDPQIIDIVSHDSSAFTQGLLIHEGKLYESTGLYGESSLRIVNTTTGQVEKIIEVPDNFFAEGLAMMNNSLLQLTWKGNLGFIYNSSSLELTGNFTYDGEGWGLCNTQMGNLWLSDGSYQLFKISSENLSLFEASLIVKYNNSPINQLNELECPFENGLIYANVWLEDRIIAINSSSGDVCFEYDFQSIRSQYENEDSKELNGIAFDPSNSLFWVTGKNWSNYYLVDLQGSSQDCKLVEQTDICCEDKTMPLLQILVIILLGIFVMPFSWPLFGLIFYKLFRRQTQLPPPSGIIEDTHGE
jgi:glutamine cyclotransferase